MKPKTAKTWIASLIAIVAAVLLSSCGSLIPGSGKLGGIANRMNGNQLLTLNQSTQGAPEKGSAANNADQDGRQVATGGIVNNFYIGANSAKQEAEKSVDALKAAANVSATGTGTSQSSGSPGVQPTDANKNNSASNDAKPTPEPAPPTPTPSP